MVKIENVQVWNADSIIPCADLEIENNIVKAIRPKPGKGKTVLMPSGVYALVHLRVPGQTEKETAESALAASWYGGVGALLTMPNTRPTLDTPEALRLGQELVATAQRKYPVNVLWSACLTKSQDGQTLVDFAELMQAGAVAFTDDGKGLPSDALMDKAYEQLSELGAPLLQHAEFPGHGGVLAPGTIQARLGVEPYFEKQEVDMVARDLGLLQKHRKMRYHLLHVSSRHSLELIARAKADGFAATCEVTPHHLAFNCESIDPDNKAFKMNPPIRTLLDQSVLRRGLVDGTIDWLATDQAPHELAAKNKPWAEAAFGTTALEASIPVLVEMMRRDGLTPQRFVQVFSERPARFLGLKASEGWGVIKEGLRLRAIEVDMEAAWTLRTSDLRTQSKNSVFIGQPMLGKVLTHHA